MIVLRLTIGSTAHDIRTDRPVVVVGSDPTADVTLAHPDLAPQALRLTRDGSEVAVELIGTDMRARLRVGDEIELAGVGVALTGMLPAGTSAAQDATAGGAGAGVVFGGYDDDLPTAAEAPTADTPAGPTRSRFELSDTTTSGERVEPPAPAARTTPPDLPKQTTPRTRTASAATTAAASAAAAPPPQRKPTPEELAASLKQIKFDPPNFGTELIEQLKASPFYAISIGFHLLLFFILSLIYTTEDKPIREGPGAIKASMQAEEEELGEAVEELEVDGLPKEPADLPDLEEMEIDEPLPDTAAPTPPKASPLRVDEELLEDPDPPQIGIMPSMRAANRQVRPRKPKMAKVDAKKSFTKGTAGQSNSEAAKVVRAQLGSGRFGRSSLNDLDEDDILVVDGSFDHIERVLDALRLKYVKKAPWELTSARGVDFRDHKIVFWNCGESLGRRRMDAIGKKLKAFVRDGGYLFTTDWGVANVIPYAFPGYIRTNGNRAHLPEMVLHIEPAPSARNHPLLEGVFLPGVKGKWWLEQASFDMSVGRKDAVTVLIECPALREQFNRSPAVAATFHFGRGRVLHAMGHYFQEAGNIAGTIAVHRLALNFVLMRLEQDKKATDR